MPRTVVQPYQLNLNKNNLIQILGNTGSFIDCGCVIDGMDITNNTGLNVNISKGDVLSEETVINVNNTLNFSLPSRQASLILMDKAGSLSSIQAQLPNLNSNTLYAWKFNNNTNITPLQGTINMNVNGVVNKVDGWLDYSVQGNNGYYISNANISITGTSEREINILYTHNGYGSAGYNILFGYGNYAANNGFFGLAFNASNKIYFASGNSSFTNTNFTMNPGDTYLLSLSYVNGKVIFKVNGFTLFTKTQTLNTQSGLMYVLKSPNISYYLNGVLHYLEIRNKAYTEDELATISNKLLLPCTVNGNSLYNTLNCNRKAVLGFIRTGSSNVVLINDSDLAYGRNNSVGRDNRKRFLGFQYATTNQTILFQNPFATVNIEPDMIFSTDITLEKSIGVQTTNANGFMVTEITPFNITIKTGTSALLEKAFSPTGVALTTGYIGLFVGVGD